MFRVNRSLEFSIIFSIVSFSSCSHTFYEHYNNGNPKYSKVVNANNKVTSEVWWYENGNVKLHLSKVTVDTLTKPGRRENEYTQIVARSCIRKLYFESGGLKEKGQIYQGNKHRVWRYWNESGILSGKAEFKEGVLIDTTIIERH